MAHMIDNEWLKERLQEHFANYDPVFDGYEDFPLTDGDIERIAEEVSHFAARDRLLDVIDDLIFESVNNRLNR